MGCRTLSAESFEASPAAARQPRARYVEAQCAEGLFGSPGVPGELPLSQRRSDQAGLEERIKHLAETRVRYGYSRIRVLLRRERWDVNAKHIYRLYEGLGARAALRASPPA